MKTYKTWEVVKMLTENPKLRFINLNTPTVLAVNDMGLLVNENQNYINVPLTSEWKLVSQPVNFIEAVKAYAKGKTIKCKLNGKLHKYEQKGFSIKNNSNYIGADDNGYYLTTAEILEGTWYIEEE